MKKYSLIGVALLLAVSLAGLFFWRSGDTARDPRLPTGADFVLQSADGEVDSKAMRGKVMLIYFGYTHCPDVCPASLAAGGQAMKSLTPAERASVRMLMVSVDPERDSVKHLKEYTAFFHPEMRGVTGSPQQIADLAKAFGAGYIRQPAAADGSYAVDHTTATYVVDREGKLAAVLDLGVSNDKIVSTIRKLL
ncbi:SCO family protein [Dechloromonas sp.]|uniref:SCO family protein n=1 Tax=Dechloromonas sp. TaxID=1917218 RepID=UPI001210D2A6|nr:SCO family protein [Dechloromonas sp.]MBU3697468.1 SCO family protein [Dechloromonas sp.]TEX44601.1 MAG: electron transport protein SCO1/SenC [Rhodocyclaceae bacterium]